MLGGLGIIPFVAGAACSCFLGCDDWFSVDYLVLYAAIVASFLGAVHWGVAITTPSETSVTEMVYSVVPSVLSWLVVIFSKGALSLLALLVIFVVTLVEDYRIGVKDLLPNWYVRLRIILTLAVCACLLIAAGGVS